MDDNIKTEEVQKPDVPGARWYVVHTYSGHENKVAATLKQRIESEHLENKIIVIYPCEVISIICIIIELYVIRRYSRIKIINIINIKKIKQVMWCRKMI